MLRILILLSVLSSVTSMACPDLAGEYFCGSGPQSRRMTIEQYELPESGGVVNYIIDGSFNLYTDALEYPGEDSITHRNVRLSAQCVDDTLIYETQADIYQNGFYQGFMEAESGVRKVGFDLTIRHKGTIHRPNGMNQPFLEVVRCIEN